MFRLVGWRPVNAYLWLRERAGLPISKENNYGSEVLPFVRSKSLPLKMECANDIFSEKTDSYRDVHYG